MPSGSARSQEVKTAFGFRTQTDLITPNDANGMWCLPKTNEQLADVTLNTEDDSADLGKGDDWARNVYLTSWDAKGTFETYVTSEIMTWLAAFALGKATKTTPGAGAFQYTGVPQNPVTDGSDLKPFTYVEGIRQGASPILDRALLGCCVEDFTVSLQRGPGRQNAKVTVNFLGTGNQVNPSGITIPSPYTQHNLRAGGATITILGDDYVALKTFESCEFGYKNNIKGESGYYPGSGSYQGADVRGRMEIGKQETFLRFVARARSNSPELAKLLAQTEGSATVGMTGATIVSAVKHGAVATWPRVRIKSAPFGNSDGFTTVAVEIAPLYDNTNGVFSLVGTCVQDNIGA